MAAGRINLLLVPVCLPCLLILGNIIFTYDHCLKPLEEVTFYGSVIAVEKTGQTCKIYISPGPGDVFIVYTPANFLILENPDILFSNPVCIRSRFWSSYYEVYKPGDIRYKKAP